MTTTRERGRQEVSQTVEITPEELAELRSLAAKVAEKKTNSRAKSSARGELIKRHKSEFDGLVTHYKANPKPRS